MIVLLVVVGVVLRGVTDIQQHVLVVATTLLDRLPIDELRLPSLLVVKHLLLPHYALLHREIVL